MTIDKPIDVVLLAKARPAEALALAHDLLSANETHDHAVARWAQGVALFELGKTDESEQALRNALAVTDVEASHTYRVRMLVSLAATVSAAGRSDEASGLLDLASATATAVEHALISSQRGLIELHAGELHASLELLQSALPTLVNEPAELPALTRVLGNIGHCLLLLDRLYESTIYHHAALGAAERTGQLMCVAGSWQNLGFTDMRLGNLAPALRALHKSRRSYQTIGETARRNLGTLYDDLAETYRVAGLGSESLQYAELAVAAAIEGGNAEKLNDARLRYAQCLFDAGSPIEASSAAAVAAAGFRSTGRPTQALRAEVLVCQADVHSPLVESVDEALSAATELAAAGWNDDALTMLNHLAQRAIDGDAIELAKRILTLPVTDRNEGLVAELEALYRAAMLAVVNDVAADTSLIEAHSLIERYRSRIGDHELRARASRLSERFRVLALRRADSPAEMVATEELWRGLSQSSASALPAQSTEEHELRSELQASTQRAVASEMPQEHHVVEIRALEQQLADVLRGRDGPDTDAASASFDLDTMVQELEHRTMISVIDDGQVLHAIAMSARDAPRRWILGSSKELYGIARRVRDQIGQLVRGGLGLRSARSLQQTIVNECRSFGRLLAPIETDVDEAVVTAPSLLTGLPWPLLLDPTTPVTVAPSALYWSTNAATVDAHAATVVIGPELPNGTADLRAFTKRFPSAVELTGEQASTIQVLESCARSSILHVACHGQFRSDSPGYSSLALADGPLMVYDLETLTCAPDVVVLAACDAGQSASLPAGELFGTTQAILRAGTTCVVAPTAPLPDDEAGVLMTAFYEALDGLSPAEAMALVRAERADADPRLWAAIHAVSCFGGKIEKVAN